MGIRALGVPALGFFASCAFDASVPPLAIDEDNGADVVEPAAFDCGSWAPGPQFFDPCALGEPGPGLDFGVGGDYLFDTDSAALVDPMGRVVTLASVVVEQVSMPARIVFVDSMRIGGGARLRVVGGLAPVFAVWGDIEIAGTLDVSSVLEAAGAAANRQCPDPTLLTGDPNGGGGGGGAGGSLLQLGAAGGEGDFSSIVGGSPVAALAATPTEVRGGCPGGSGGVGTADDDYGIGGSGGGAVLLSARGSVVVSGEINAGGEGGTSGNDYGGGGGGGSGGFIGLEGEIVSIEGSVLANGGGGAAGAAHASVGGPGMHARLAPTGPADGGTYTHNHAGNGGAGAYLERAPGLGGVDDDSGGGGGGGVGIVLVLE